MSDTCPRGGFDRTLVSGHLDGELTQGDAQRVRLHLEDCADCRALYDRLSTVRGATMTTPFTTPSDDQWDERPKGPWARITRGAGWLLLAVWLVTILFVVFDRVPEEPAGWIELLLVGGLWGGLALLLVSVLIDRLRGLPRDRYRGVRK